MGTPTQILVVVPHPDDAESRVAGKVARWTREGREVVYVVTTNGNKGTGERDIGPDELTILLAAIKGSSYYLYHYTPLLTRLRRSELLVLKWRDIDLDLASIYVSHSLQKLGGGEVVFRNQRQRQVGAR